MAPPGLGRHIALTGFMGAGKTTIGERVADRLWRWPFIDVDREIEEEHDLTVAELFEERGEDGFRLLEWLKASEVLDEWTPHVIALGGGSVMDMGVQMKLRDTAFTVLIDVDVDVAWERVRDTDRPLARDREEFRRLYEERAPVYAHVADAVATDSDGVLLAAAGVVVELGGINRLRELVPGDGPVALVTEAAVDGVHGESVRAALGERLREVHVLPTGEDAKSLAVVERLWRDLRLSRAGAVVAVGGGAVLDAAGFASATYMRGIDWVAVPTTVLAQVDAAIGGKTAIDLPEAKNLVGAFHWPARAVIDPTLLETLSSEERRNGLAEIVKTGLLAGEELWERPEAEAVRACAAFKAAVCLRDPYDDGPRKQLNLGHTFAHALEAASDYSLSHGRAVALGLTAALRISERHLDLDPGVRARVEEVLDPRPVRVDRGRAWDALRRDKKDGRLVLLERPGVPVWTPDPIAHDEIRAALDALIEG